MEYEKLTTEQFLKIASEQRRAGANNEQWIFATMLGNACERITQLKSALTALDWVSVSSGELPKEKREVLVYYTYETNQNSYTGIAFLSGNMWYSDDGKTTFKTTEVTYWKPIILPLPKPSKGGV